MTDDEFDRMLAEERAAHDELIAALKAKTASTDATEGALASVRDVLIGGDR